MKGATLVTLMQLPKGSWWLPLRLPVPSNMMTVAVASKIVGEAIWQRLMDVAVVMRLLRCL